MLKILLVEDDANIRALLSEGLRRRGFEVTEAHGGNEAFEKSGLTKFDLVITDIVMAEGEGVELLTRMRKRTPGLPIIVMSGGGGPHLTPDYLEGLVTKLGAAAFLAKPFDFKRLYEVIAELEFQKDLTEACEDFGCCWMISSSEAKDFEQYERFQTVLVKLFVRRLLRLNS